MAFRLFLLLNAVLLLRPEELLSDIAGLRLYLIVIGLCLLTAAPRLIDTLQPYRLAERPITVCVLGVWAATILSQLARGQLGLALDFGADFGKVILYYLLLISVINTPERLRAFLRWVVLLVIIQAGLALLQFHGLIDIAALAPLERREYGADDEVTVIPQLRGSGIYNDPNDLCLILVTGSICALACAATASGLPTGLLWLPPVGVFGYALVLTQSRGGILGLMAALFTWACGRFGWKRAVPLALVAGPGLLLAAGGRQANMNLGKEDTAQHRVELWSEGFVAMMRNPLTGIGAGEYGDEVGLVAHNSYVHGYVELGLFGGSLFLGAFYFGAVGIVNSRPDGRLLARLRPFVLAVVVGYAGGIFTISRNYVVPTYTILGIADAYLRLVSWSSAPARWSRDRFVTRILVLGVAGWVILRFLTQVLRSLG